MKSVGVLLVFASALYAESVTYVVSAEDGVRGGELGGWISWEKGSPDLTLGAAADFAFSYSDAAGAVTWWTSSAASIQIDASSFVGALGDLELIPTQGHRWQVYQEQAGTGQPNRLLMDDGDNGSGIVVRWTTSELPRLFDYSDAVAPLPDWRLVAPISIPEPGTLALLGLGGVVLVVMLRRRPAGQPGRKE